MSVIGPRPLLVEYLPYYTKEEHHRHDVRPGLSGWAQINGRNAIDSWEQRFQYDLEYVKNVSFAFDIRKDANDYTAEKDSPFCTNEDSSYMFPSKYLMDQMNLTWNSSFVYVANGRKRYSIRGQTT